MQLSLQGSFKYSPVQYFNGMERIRMKIPQIWLVPNKPKRDRSLSDHDLNVLCDEDEDDVISKLWSKDEAEDGAIFSATLKKVRYRSSVGSSADNDVSCLLWETLKIRVLKAGTLSKIIEHLTPSNESVSEDDPGFFVCFLCTYKTFASTQEVVDLLVHRYRTIKEQFNNGEISEKHANHVFSAVLRVLSVWLDHYPADFDEPPSYQSLETIINFLQNDVNTSGMVDKVKEMKDKLCVSPFDYEDPFGFKFCNCDTPVGCKCGVVGSPSFRGELNNLHEDTNITSFSTSLVAEQLTLIDAELFRRVIPRHCLACYWSKRDQLQGTKAPITIKATVDNFNAVVMAVTTSILDAVGVKTKLKDAHARVKVISTWIEIARECRNLKNFSALKAILSGLQSTPIHRLKKTWPLLPKENQSLYEELSEIFSDDLNSKASRDLLMQEGTAKYATIDGRSGRKSLKKRASWIREGVVQGTVPYLGTFLTDLTMIDSANPNKLENGYINFNKRRKEFEVIAQIKLLQEAAKNYQLNKDPDFLTWFRSIKPYSEKESYKKSCELEPNDRATTPQAQRKISNLQKHASVPDLFSKVFDDEDGKVLQKFSTLLSRKISKTLSPNGTPEHSPTNLGKLSPEDKRVFQDEEKEVARIMIEGCHEHVYKSVWVSSNDRTHDIIKKGLEKYNIKCDAQDYHLYQVIPGSKDLHLPHNTNIFYAVNKSVELKFRLKKKRKESLHRR
ncbi:ral guanine nucleotide dissociation stimulator-like 1 isoform X2 [Rhopilema esculentum]|uniref:ral guanine nucleotide dissociation stimulator-like 1 isoform X2 n=1 Tax=Rhopilema esculentum TaxID=499914 RepID=UPI0031DE7B03